MKKAKSLQRFWAFLLVFVLVATTVGHDSMTVTAAETNTVAEQESEPESTSEANKENVEEDAPAPSTDSSKSEEKAEVEEGAQTPAVTDPAEVPSEGGDETTLATTDNSEAETDSTNASLESAIDSSADTTEDEAETTDVETTAVEDTENEKVTYKVNFNISGEAVVKVNGETVSSTEVEEGNDLQFSVEADGTKGYRVKEVKVGDNVLAETDGVYTVSEIDGDVTVDVSTETAAGNTALYASQKNGTVSINSVDGDVYPGMDITLSFSKTGIDEEDITSVSWEITSGSEFASIDSQNGKFKAMKAGSVKVHLTVNYKYSVMWWENTSEAESTINIQIVEPPVSVTGVTITNKDSKLIVGKTLNYAWEVVPSDAVDKSVTWSSSNESVATVNNDGKVTALSAGNTTITVTTLEGGFTDFVDLTVENAPVAVETVKIEGTNTVNIGKQITLNAVYEPENAEVKEITWHSGDESVATIDDNGIVTGVSEGIVDITVTIDGIQAHKEIVVLDPSSVKPIHTLTINYVYSENAGAMAGRTAADSYSVDVREGSVYKRTSPVISGFQANQEIVQGTMPNKDLTITVEYNPTETSYTVQHKFQQLDGSYVTENETKQGMYGSETEAQARTVKGFEAGVVDNTTIGRNTVIVIEYTRLNYTIRFDSAGGSYVTAIEAPFESQVTLGKDQTPARDGYIFEGWLNNSGNKVTSISLTDNMLLTASWSVDKNATANYKIMYWIQKAEGNDYDFLYSQSKNGKVGTEIKSSDIPDISSAELSKINLEKAGFTYSRMDTGITIDVDGSAIVNVYYNRKSFTLKFFENKRDRNPIHTITDRYGAWINDKWPRECIWENFSGGDGKSYAGMQVMPASNMSFEKSSTGRYKYNMYYMVEPVSGNTYIEHHLDSFTSNTNSWELTKGDRYPITGFTFNENDNRNVPRNIGGSLKTNNYLYYTRNSYTIEFSANGGNNAPGSSTYKYEATITAPKGSPAREGYEFTGWYYDPGAKSSVQWGSDTMPANNMTVYAGWKIKTYPVIFDENYEGGNKTTVNVGYKNTVGEPELPVREGYNFLGWYTQAESGTKYDFGTPVKNGFTLYAHWSPKNYTSYTVKYLEQGTEKELYESKTVSNLRIGKTVTEWAVDLEEKGYVPVEASQSLVLAQSGNEITFYYTNAVERKYTVTGIDKDTKEVIYGPAEYTTQKAAVWVSAPEIGGYLLAEGQNPSIYREIYLDSSKNEIVFEYQQQKVTYQVYYYVDGVHQTEWNESSGVTVGTEISSVVNKCPNGYHEEKIVPALPTTITSNNKLIEVYYVENDDVTIEYKAKTGGSVTPDHETLAPVKDTAVGSVATPDAGYHFVRWTDAKGNEVGTNPKFVPEKVNGVNAAATYYAVFEENAAITIHYNATAGGSVTPGSETLAPVSQNAAGSIATANTGYHFEKWTDEQGNTVGTELKFIPQKVNGVNVAATYTAHFAENEKVTINYVARVGGKVEPASETLAPVTEEAAGSRAIPAAGYEFDKWVNEKGDIVGTAFTFVPEKVNGVNVAATYYAVFKEKQKITINYVAEGNGKVTPKEESLAPATGVAEGSTATPDYGYKLTKWTDSEGTIVSDALHFIPEKVNGLNVAETYTAHFEKDTSLGKEISYTVEYWLEGESAARDSYDVTKKVWVNDPDTLDVEDIEKKEYPGYSYNRVDHEKAGKGILTWLLSLIPSEDLPKTVENGDLLKVIYTENVVTINYAAEANGSVTRENETLKAVKGEAEGSTAEAANGYHFANWTNSQGTVVSSEAEFVPQKVNGLNVADTYTAHFEENGKIEINYIPNIGGSVSRGSETLAPATGTAEGSVATAAAGYTFESWTDAKGNIISTEASFVPAKVNGLNVAATYYANFKENAAVIINYVANTGGSVSEKRETLAPATGTAKGSAATAAAGYTFENWTDKDKNVVSTDVLFIPAKVDGLNVAATYYANFKENADVTINYVANTGGSVSEERETLAPATGTAKGSVATAAAGYTFESWTDTKGNIISTEASFVPAKVNGLNVAATYYANFKENAAVIINYVANTGGSVSEKRETLAPATGTAKGSAATAAAGYTFENWTDKDKNVVSTDVLFIPAKVDGLNVAATYYANFKENADVTINYVANTGGSVSEERETLAPATGTAKGSVATAAAGYTFESWTDTKGNIISTEASFVPAKVNGLNVAATYFANFKEDEEILITYLAEANGKVSLGKENLAPATGKAEGSTAAPDYGYKLKNWTNSKSDIVSEELHFIPEKVGGLNVADTYTAHFEEDRTIEKTLSYRVEYWIDGETDARDAYEVTKEVWVNDPDTLDVEDIEQKEYPGYSYNRVEHKKANQGILNMLMSLVPSADVPNTVGNGDVLRVIYTEDQITINYQADANGSVSRENETLFAVNGDAQGSTAAAANGYHFVNWTNEAGEVVSTDAAYVPVKVNGLHVAATYTAHFAANTPTPTDPTPDPTPGTPTTTTPTATTAVLGEAFAPVQPEVGVLGEALAPEVGVLGEAKGPGTGDTAPIAGWSFLIMGAILTLGVTAKRRKKEEE